jgi:hypothetical protein
MIPYLGEGLKSTNTLSFANPVDMDQKELIVFFKLQSAAQGIHLMTIQSSTNQKLSERPPFHPWMPSPPCLSTKRQLSLQSYSTASAPFIPQCNPEVKIGAPRKSTKTRGSRVRKWHVGQKQARQLQRRNDVRSILPSNWMMRQIDGFS